MSPIAAGIEQFTTTTIFPAATVTASAIEKAENLPVGVIVGGTAGGVVLAIVVVAAWIIWGKSIKRTKAKQQREADKLRITKQNTMTNATAFSPPRNYTYRPLFWPPSETKVKFAGLDGSLTSAPTSKYKGKGAEPHPKQIIQKTPSKPKPLRSTRKYNNLRASSRASAQPPSPTPVEHATIPTPTEIAHKPSTISSESFYSMESADSEDPQQTRRSPLQSLLAVLGNLSSEALHPGTRNSYGSNNRWSVGSNWSWLTRNTNNRGGGGMNRLSQATSGSAYSQPDDRSSHSVGVAY